MPSIAKIAAVLPILSSVAFASSGMLQMKAATRRSDLQRRDLPIRAAYTTELLYADVENAHDLSSTYFAKVNFGSDLPVLKLEDFEDHLTDVRCEDSKIHIDLRTRDLQDSLRAALHHESGAYIITSHDSCNREGERLAYHVPKHTSNWDTNGLVLDAVAVPFNRAFKSMDLAWGHSMEGHHFRNHRSLRRRQEGPPAPFPLPANDGSPGVTIDLNNAVLDTPLEIPAEVAGLLPVQIPVEIRCIECSTTGTLDLTAGEFAMDLSVFDGDGVDFIQSGSVVLTGNGVGARLELGATPAGEVSFEIPLPSIPIPALGFAIPGIGEAGVNFQPELAMSFGASGGIDISFGLQSSIPDGSTITLDFADFGNSAVQGFTEPTVEALPFQANVTAVELTVSAGFRPRLTLGFEFVGSATAEVGLFADLPSLSATVSTQQNVDGNCNPLPEGSDPAAAADPLNALGGFTLVDFGIGVAVGVDAVLEAPVIPDFETELTIAATTFQLATTCLAPDAAATGLVPAAPVVSSMIEAGEVASWVAELPDVPPETPLAPAYTPPAMQPHPLPPMPHVMAPAAPVAPEHPKNTSVPKMVYQITPSVAAPEPTVWAAPGWKAPSRVMRGVM